MAPRTNRDYDPHKLEGDRSNVEGKRPPLDSFLFADDPAAGHFEQTHSADSL
jgi:hypothetical protein